jgi:hypothetical protein
MQIEKDAVPTWYQTEEERKMESTQISHWLEQDESLNFGGVFCIDKDEMEYLINVLEFAIKAPNYQFNKMRLIKLTALKTHFKNKLEVGYEFQKNIDRSI